MSILHATAPYRRDEHATLRVPVVLPLVTVTVAAEGCLDVLLDREPYSADGALHRSDLGRILDQIAAELDSPVRVEVHEPDGSVFTDIVTPPPSGPETRTEQRNRPAMVSAFGISGEGFHPGEDVVVAVVVARHVAGDDGTAQLRLPPALMTGDAGVLLFGRTSGALVFSDGAA